MKKRLLKAMVSIFLSVVLGFFCGYLVYSTYSKETTYLVSGDYIYMLEYNKYDDYDSMKLANMNNDYTYYKDNDSYYKVIGFSRDKSNIEKIKKIYGDVEVVKCYVTSEEFNKKIDEFDKIIKDLDNEDKIKNTLGEVLNYYKDNKVEIKRIYS